MCKNCKEKLGAYHFFAYWWSDFGYTLKGGVRCLQFDDEKIISGSWDMTVMVGVLDFKLRWFPHNIRAIMAKIKSPKKPS